MLSRSHRRKLERNGDRGNAAVPLKEPISSAPPPPQQAAPQLPPAPPPDTSPQSPPPLIFDSSAFSSFPHISTGIYAAPTVDTLEDETVASSHRMTAFSTNGTTTVLHASSRLELHLTNSPDRRTPVRKNAVVIGGVYRHTPPHVKDHFQYEATNTVKTTRPPATVRMESMSPPPPTSNHNMTTTTSTSTTTITTTQNSKIPRDFLREEDAMTVTIQNVNIGQRSAFELQPPPSLAYWHAVAQEAERNLLAATATTKSIRNSEKETLSFVSTFATLAQNAVCHYDTTIKL